MNLTLQIINDEDINYINNIHNDNKDKLIRTAISIGLKSIQMSEVKMDCHSYIDPIRDLIYNSTEINTNKINPITRIRQPTTFFRSKFIYFFVELNYFPST